MKLLTKKKFEEQGYAIVKNVLNFDNDLKPILNDMEYVMDRLIHKFYTKKKNIKSFKI
jgi:ectoine hydroxylase-related dioxygenase (phytanoyl-CoA dioxygenase family)